MANVKITELTAATALAGTDVLPIVDVGADATKKVSVSDLLRNLPDGTASAPALAFADDQNTGVLSPGNNSLAFATSGTQRLVIDSSGNIGINETSPGQRLVVGGDMRIGFTTPTDAARSLVFDSNRSSAAATLTNITFNWNSTAVSQIRAIAGADTTNKDDGELAFFTSAANSILERLRIDSSGRVGIGTSSPSNNLDILSTTSGATVNARVGSTATSGVNNANLIINNGGTGNATLRFDYESSTNRASIGVPQSTQALFFTTAGSERVRIDSSGNVGIGLTSPTEFVDIRKDQNAFTWAQIQNQNSSSGAYAGIQFGAHGNTWGIANGSSAANSNSLIFVTDAGGSNSEKMRIDSSGRLMLGTTTPGVGDADEFTVAGSGNIGITIRSGSSSSGNIFFSDTTSGTGEYDGYIQYRHGDRALRFATQATERMRIDSSGRLLIGATSGTELLEVHGDTPVLKLRDTSSHASQTGPAIAFQGNDSNGAIKEFSRIRGISQSADNGQLAFDTRTGGSLVERMRISANGSINCFSNGAYNYRVSSTSASDIAFSVRKGATDVSNGTNVCIIRADGDLENANNTYAAISDAKLKENIVDANSQWSDIKALQVRNYNFIEGQTHTQIGVVAQEVETVSPGLVSESPDLDDDGNDLGTVTKSVNYSVLYMKAVKALQEAMDRIETLEAKVAALEAQ